MKNQNMLIVSVACFAFAATLFAGSLLTLNMFIVHGYPIPLALLAISIISAILGLIFYYYYKKPVSL